MRSVHKAQPTLLAHIWACRACGCRSQAAACPSGSPAPSGFCWHPAPVQQATVFLCWGMQPDVGACPCMLCRLTSGVRSSWNSPTNFAIAVGTFMRASCWPGKQQKEEKIIHLFQPPRAGSDGSTVRQSILQRCMDSSKTNP